MSDTYGTNQQAPANPPQGSTSFGDVVTQLSNIVRQMSSAYQQMTSLISTIAAIKFPQAVSGYAVAGLPASPSIGTMAYVTDGAGSLAWGATATGGGSSQYLVWFNGANWTVVGK